MAKPEQWYRQSAVIPYRLTQQIETGPPSVEVLLITSRKRKRWVIPKGIVEPKLSPLESALKEAYEEAAAIRDIPSGCRFHTRCPLADSRCVEKEPELMEVSQDRWAACYFSSDVLTMEKLPTTPSPYQTRPSNNGDRVKKGDGNG